MPIAADGLVHPSLLERLIDDHPETHHEDVGAGWGMTPEQWRESILRNLDHLVNTPSTFPGSVRHALFGSRTASLESLPVEWREHLEPAFSSTLNYGVPPIAGSLMGAEEVDLLAESLRVAIERFEPRIIPESVSVSPIESAHDWNYGAVVGFVIEAEIGPDPISMNLRMRTLVDTAAGLLRPEWDLQDADVPDSAG